jgi:hypothetical protein
MVLSAEQQLLQLLTTVLEVINTVNGHQLTYFNVQRQVAALTSEVKRFALR